MNVLGVDFTSRPRKRKPITCIHGTLDGNVLRAKELEEWADFTLFEAALQRPGPWIAGLDFPFGQSRRFVETIGWPDKWESYVRHAESLGRRGFRAMLDAYRSERPSGDKEHRRQTDIAAGSISPQKLYGVPVGLMFFEGAPRLLDSGVFIPRLRAGDSTRVVVETYPGVLARQVINRRPYKHDTRKKQTKEQRVARRDLFDALESGQLYDRYGFVVEADRNLCSDPGGDHLDALLCAIQAAWAWRNRDRDFGAPDQVDPLEGWIADPSLQTRAVTVRSSRKGS